MLAATNATRYSRISAKYFPRPSPGGSCARVLRTDRGSMDRAMDVDDPDPEGRRGLAEAG